MKWLAAVALLGTACIRDSDVSGALASYCTHENALGACSDDADCCPSFTCSAGACARVVTCLAADAGTVTVGGSCGCAADCVTGTCTEAKCR